MKEWLIELGEQNLRYDLTGPWDAAKLDHHQAPNHTAPCTPSVVLGLTSQPRGVDQFLHFLVNFKA